MRAIRVSTLDGVDALTLEDIPPPTPRPGEVRIKVYVGGVNFPDLLMSEGKYQFKAPLPFTPGLEAAALNLTQEASYLTCAPEGGGAVAQAGRAPAADS